ncbi:MAG: hypothetical protein ABWY58_04065 [Aeromicrobium sp.]
MEDLEHGAVEELSAFVARFGVELLGMAQEVGDVVEASEEGVAAGLCVLDESLGIGDFDTHLGLPLLQNLDGHGVGHVGVEQFRLVTLEFGEAP